MGLASVNILTIRFWSLKIFELWEEVPQKIKRYVITE
jgi:hypothetical protein